MDDITARGAAGAQIQAKPVTPQQAPTQKSPPEPLRIFGWILLVVGSIATPVTYIAPVAAYLNWLSVICAFVGLCIIGATRKIHLDEGEILLYKGSANVGEGGLKKSNSKAAAKVVVTNKAVKIGNLFDKKDQIDLPYTAITNVERLDSLSVRINAANTSLKLQFGRGQANKFLSAIAQNGVQIPGGVDV
jgi:hypothetical protein